MKKSIFLLAAAMICGMLFTACDKEKEPEFPHFEYDKSLAGSVYCSYSPIGKADGSYDGVPFEAIPMNFGGLDIGKVSDSEISMYYSCYWDNEIRLKVSIPAIHLSGVSYDVTFDQTVSGATIEYNQAEYTGVDASVKGWIKNLSFLKTRTSPISANNIFDITIECEIDGKKLILNISRSYD